MKFPVLPNVTVVLTICASLIAALPLEAEAIKTSSTKNIRRSDCSMQKIRECVNDTGLESTLCLAQVCASAEGETPTPTPRNTKRQDDQCTEENLVQCAIMEWREAEICFQEFCL
ncbi:hypothetical protein F4819DRAFT_487924 [Hypoxylon fuscum]|nr:hypothetical protein F4819DRAFT_487924 [Hypoxylon fuscum]